MKNILALDCAHECCSAAVLTSDGEMFSEARLIERGQAEALFPMILNVLAAAGKEFKDLDSIAVTTGPGSFTGVRVGLAAARGIAMAADLPVSGVSVMEAAAFLVQEKCPDLQSEVCVVLETKRDDFYAQRFVRGKPVSLPQAIEGSALKKLCHVTLAGNGVARFIKENGSVPFVDVPMPAADTVARLAAEKTPSKEYPSPLYLREAEVTLCRK